MGEKDDFDELLEECLQDPEFRKEWEESEAEWKKLRQSIIIEEKIK